jgi:copper homeostasis protein CutC
MKNNKDKQLPKIKSQVTLSASAIKKMATGGIGHSNLLNIAKNLKNKK